MAEFETADPALQSGDDDGGRGRLRQAQQRPDGVDPLARQANRLEAYFAALEPGAAPPI